MRYQASRANQNWIFGNFLKLCPSSSCFMGALACPKELWVFEDVFYPMGEVVADIYRDIANWLLDALAGNVRQGHKEYTYVAS